MLPPSQVVNEGQSSQAVQQKRKFRESEMGEMQGVMPVPMVIDLEVEPDDAASKLVEVEPRKRAKHDHEMASIEGALAAVKKAVVQGDKDEDDDKVMRRWKEKVEGKKWAVTNKDEEMRRKREKVEGKKKVQYDDHQPGCNEKVEQGTQCSCENCSTIKQCQ